MASKFFSWAKGDRRHAAEACRAACLADHHQCNCCESGTGNRRHDLCRPMAVPKQGVCSHGQSSQRPTPTTLAVAPAAHEGHGASTSCLAPASLLHDASLDAVSSATNLLAIVNDMLCPPALEHAPLPQSAYQKPLFGRPRSHTAPPSPVIPELPGSILLENQGFPLPPLLDPAAPQENAISPGMKQLSPGDMFGPAVNRPQTSPMDGRGGLSHHRKSKSENQLFGKLTWTLNPSPPSGQSSYPSPLRPKRQPNARSRSHDDTWREVSDSEGSHRSLRRPTANMAGGRRSRRPSHDHAPYHEVNNSSHHSGLVEDLRATITAHEHTISSLTAQFATLRNTHEEHVASLMEAHSKELASLKTYINVLEEQTRTFKDYTPQTSSTHLMLMLDTSQLDPERRKALPEAVLSATSLQSYQSSGTEHSRATQDSRLDSSRLNDPLPRIPDDEVEAIRRERDDLRQTLGDAQRQVDEVLEQLNESRKGEKALQSTLDSLHARLEDTNEQKVDVLEENHDLKDKVRKLEERGKDLAQEIETLRDQPAAADVDKLKAELKDAELRVNLLESQLKAANDESEIPGTLINFTDKIEQLQEELNKKNKYIVDLEEENQICRQDMADVEHRHAELLQINTTLKAQQEERQKATGEPKSAGEEAAELTFKVAEHEKTIRTFQAERDQINLLLQAEIRKQAYMADKQEHPATSPLSSKNDVEKAIAEIDARVKAQMTPDGNSTSYTPEIDPMRRIEQLEKEIEYHVKDIVLYKLDVKGYKKDLKRANMRIQRLSKTVESPANIPAPLSTRTSRNNSNSSVVNGLGISEKNSSNHSIEPPLDSPSPQRPATSGSMLGERMSTPPPSSPLERSISPKTPLGPHKRLPRPPSTPPQSRIASGASKLPSPPSTKRSPSKRLPSSANSSRPLATHFPLNTPAKPQRTEALRSLSESLISYGKTHTPVATPDRAIRSNSTSATNSASASGSGTGSSLSAPPKRLTYADDTPASSVELDLLAGIARTTFSDQERASGMALSNASSEALPQRERSGSGSTVGAKVGAAGALSGLFGTKSANTRIGSSNTANASAKVPARRPFTSITAGPGRRPSNARQRSIDIDAAATGIARPSPFSATPARTTMASNALPGAENKAQAQTAETELRAQEAEAEVRPRPEDNVRSRRLLGLGASKKSGTPTKLPRIPSSATPSPTKVPVPRMSLLSNSANSSPSKPARMSQLPRMSLSANTSPPYGEEKQRRFMSRYNPFAALTNAATPASKLSVRDDAF